MENKINHAFSFLPLASVFNLNWKEAVYVITHLKMTLPGCVLGVEYRAHCLGTFPLKLFNQTSRKMSPCESFKLFICISMAEYGAHIAD